MRDWVTFPDGTRGRRSWDADPQKAGAWQRRLAQAGQLAQAFQIGPHVREDITVGIGNVQYIAQISDT